MKRLMFVVISLALLLGCTRVDQDSVGAEVRVTPVTYTLELEVKDFASANEKLNRFTERHAEYLQGQDLVLTWHSEKGKKFLGQYASPQGALYSLKVIKGKEEHTRFDIEARFIHSEITVEPCLRDNIEAYENQLGCYTENARWQSMVNPHKAILSFYTTFYS